MDHCLPFVTLGPTGTNHEMIARKYIEARGIEARVVLIDDFFDGLKMVHEGNADFLFQVAVHPDCADVVAEAHFQYGIHITDTFISPSKDLRGRRSRDAMLPSPGNSPSL